MYVMTDQLVRQDGRQPLKLLINNHIVSPTKSCSWVLPNAFSNFAFPFGASGGRSKRHHLERRSWRKMDSTDDGRDGHLTFLLIQFAFLFFNRQLRQKFILHSVNRCIVVLDVPSGHFCKNRIEERWRNKKKKKKKVKKGYTYFSLLGVFFSESIQKAQVQESDRIDDEDPPNRQSCQSHKQTLKQLQHGSNNSSPS